MLRRLRRLGFHMIERILHSKKLMIVPEALSWLHADYAHKVVIASEPELVLDVGANVGQFAIELRKLGYQGRIISFEPQPGPFEALQKRVGTDPNWSCRQLALGDAESTMSMHISQFSVSSSLLPIGKLHIDLMPHSAEADPIQVCVARLDSMAEELQIRNKRVFLKLDVQGYELSALRGAGALLKDVCGAIVELNFAPLFDGQSAHHEVMEILTKAGLRFTGLTDIHCHPTTNDFLWADGIFLRR